MATATSSSSTTPNQQTYDVFISSERDFGGFLVLLQGALERAKIKTYFDNGSNKGDDVSETLLKTIKESKIFIVVFCKNYAVSRRFLNVLVQIMECNEKNAQTVIPIFLNIYRRHVRHQLESFERALATHGDHPKIQRWRDALIKAANLSGWHSQITGATNILIKRVVSCILEKLKYTSQGIFDDLIGMSSHFKQIDKIINMIFKEVRIIGFWGIGGIGKSTLAKAFFGRDYPKFKGHYMIENFEDTCEKGGLNELQLISGLLKDEKLNVGTHNLVNPLIRDRLRRTKALIVLDGINNFLDIEILVQMRDYLGSGSVVIITSRDKNVLTNRVDEIYEIPGLGSDEALRLFAQHAFKQEHPIDFHGTSLSNRAINYANGNPLVLKVLGCHFHGRSNEEQESALSKFVETPNMNIQKVLQITYENLDKEEKNIFLNIACFFKGKTKDWIECFHNSCGYFMAAGIRVLVDKSLIIVDKDGRVWMHDFVKEMGKEIVRTECIDEPGKRSRLWDHNDISHVLTNNTGTEAIKFIRLDNPGIKSFSINPMAFKGMYNLEFLEVGWSSDSLLRQGLQYLPNQLRYLCWYRYPLKYLPPNFDGENLVQLIMTYSNVKHLWNGTQFFPHLKKIDLSFSHNLIEIPDLSLASNLQELMLEACTRLQNLSSSLYSLRTLNISRCYSIKKFSVVSTKIEYLDLSSTAIKEVPSLMGCFASIITLNLGYCERIKNLPAGIYKLKSLQFLDISLLPEEEREHLEEVNIHPRKLTNSLGCLSALKRLSTSGNDFQEIPASIIQLTNLEYLNLEDCKRLQSLPQLPVNVRMIKARNCASLEVVASPLTRTTKREFDSVVEQDINFDFSYSLKLNQNARDSIVRDVESKLLQWEFNCPETFSQRNRVAQIYFTGGDIPDWFKYKSLGSSLTVELPKHWCNSDLFCLGVGVVLEFMAIPGQREHYILDYDCHIRNNIGDCTSGKGPFIIEVWRTEDVVQSNHVYLEYGQSCMINEWRMIPKKTEYATMISIEFHVQGSHCNVKMCGIHLLNKDEFEGRCRTSRIDSDFPIGLTQLFFNPDSVEEDTKETGIGDIKGDGGSHDNCSNTDNTVEFLTSMRRKKLKK